MKKYNDCATTRNIPNLYLYTKLIGLGFFFTGINFIITFFYLKFAVAFEYSILLLILGVLMLVLAPVAMTDNRKGMRDSLYTVSSVVILIVCTVADVIWFKFYWLLIPLTVELVLIAAVSISYKRKRLNKKKK